MLFGWGFEATRMTYVLNGVGLRSDHAVLLGDVAELNSGAVYEE